MNANTAASRAPEPQPPPPQVNDQSFDLANDELPVFEFEDGARFNPTERKHPGGSPFVSADGKGKKTPWTDEELKAFVGSLWSDAWEARRPEIERLKRNSLYYDGFHYTTGWENRSAAITNRIYSVVEQQVALSTIGVPRPEIVPRGWDDSDKAMRLQSAAEYIEDGSDFDQAIYLGARDKYIYGYNIWLISFDHASGMPFVKNLSVFDHYPDPVARSDDDAYYHIIATSQPTNRLRATFHEVADQIEPDRIASPAYEIAVKPWQEILETGGGYDSPMSPASALIVHKEGETPTQAAEFTFDPGATREHGNATFVIQLLIRDDEMVDVTYTGRWQFPNGTETVSTFKNAEPRCPSGWWLVSYASNGVRLHEPYQIDACYLGLPFVVDRSYQRTDRYESGSDVDHMIPIQREMNRRKALMMRSLELSANPPVIATAGHGMGLDRGTVAGGEMLTINRGSEVKYLNFQGPAQQQFEMLHSSDRDLGMVSGVPDVQRGVGASHAEAAATVRRLDENSMRRMNAKENPAHRARAQLLRKLLYSAGCKLQSALTFKSPAGDLVTVTPEELRSEVYVRYARGSGTPDGRLDLRETALMLFQQGVIDQKDLLDVYQWPNRGAIVKRKQAADAQQAALAAAAPQPGGGGGAAPPGTGQPPTAMGGPETKPDGMPAVAPVGAGGP